jgi:hypothetical protein
MSRDDDRLEEAARALREAMPPATVPAGLADRAFRAAMSAAPGPFAERFVLTARRAALVGAIATALVWGGVLLRDRAPADTAAAAALDPAEAALSLWVGEEAPGGD